MEPWLRGTIPHADPILRALHHSFEQVREEAGHWTASLPDGAIWREPHGLNSIGFELRHMAGSVERLASYAMGRSLTEAQLAALKQEKVPGASRSELLAALNRSLSAALAELSTVDPARFSEPRSIGRQQLPTSLGGLIVHIAEHTQRHLGRLILLCKLVSG
jgi:uncharacterized damage-inducible protein DinB